MPKDPFIYVNGMDETLDQALTKMRGYNRRYLRDMGTVIDAERGLLSRESLDKYSPKQLKEMVMQRIGRNNLTDPMHGGRLPILCKDGKLRYYRPDAWSETIARTRSRALQEEGLHNQMTRAGFDLVQVSIGGSGDPCTNWEGMVLSITGETPGYPTVDEAQESGDIFHPRCVHSTSPFLITEDENGPRIWGRDDLTPQAQEQVKNAGLTRKGTIRNGLNAVLLTKGTAPPVNMVSTNVAKNHTEAIKSAGSIADNAYFTKTMDLNGVNDAVYALDNANRRFLTEGKLAYIGSKDHVRTVVGPQYSRFKMGSHTSAMYARFSGGSSGKVVDMIVWRKDAMNDALTRKIYRESAEILTKRFGEHGYEFYKRNGVAAEVIDILKKQKTRHWALSGELGGTKGVVYHEYGHKILYGHKKNRELRNLVRQAKAKGWALPLGKYAEASQQEFFAETFAAYMNGLTHLIEPNILKWLEDNDQGA